MENKFTVILIDDHHPTNILHKVSIKAANCTKEIISFTNPEVALIELEDYILEKVIKPIVIFLDINMPVMNAWRFLEKYRPLVQTLEKPPLLFILTTSDHPDDIARAQKNDLIEGYLQKLLTTKQFEEIVQKYNLNKTP